jgi:hypothetical protein
MVSRKVFAFTVVTWNEWLAAKAVKAVIRSLSFYQPRCLY